MVVTLKHETRVLVIGDSMNIWLTGKA